MNNFRRPNRPDLDATKIPTAIDIAWAAGIYEGEGSCHLAGGKSNTGKQKRGLMVSVPQKDPELLYWLRDWFGGSITRHSQGCSQLHICGDRARVFLALIYKFMTARRKQQIDAIGSLDFLGNTSPVGMSIDMLKAKLSDYYAEHDKTTLYGNPELARARSRDKYQEKATSDPSFLENEKLRARRDRAKRTPEQLAAASEYQRNYYQKKKQKLHLVEMKNTA